MPGQTCWQPDNWPPSAAASNEHGREYARATYAICGEAEIAAVWLPKAVANVA